MFCLWIIANRTFAQGQCFEEVKRKGKDFVKMESKDLRVLALFPLLCILVSRPAVDASTVDRSSSLKRTSKVVSHDLDLPSTESSKAVLSHDPLASLPSSFTICSTIMAPAIFQNDQLPFVYILGKDGNYVLRMSIKVYTTEDGIVTTYLWEQQWKELEHDGKEFHAFSHQWIKSCVAFNGTSGVYQVVADGIFVRNCNCDFVRNCNCDWANMPTDLSGKVVLGAYESMGRWPSARSKVTNLNVFSTAHSVEWMRKSTIGGECVEDGDYLAWKDMQWTLHGQAVIENVNAEDTCLGEPVVDVFHVKMDYISCVRLCENLGSRAFSIVTRENWLSVKNFFDRHNDFKVWIAIDDNDKEGEWRDHYTDQVSNHSEAWYSWAPDEGTGANNAYLTKDIEGQIGLDDAPGYSKYGCPCENLPQAFLKLRGLCKNSAISTYYQPKNDVTDINQLRLIGLSTTIEYNKISGLWKLSVAESNVTGLSKTSLESFTLGRHNWTISGDQGCNEDLKSDSYTVELKMSGCKEGEFTCNDGQCVSMDHRCDQLPDCRDRSDERGCDILVLENSYNKNVPPITSQNRLMIPVNVNTSIDIFKLVDINEEDYSIEIQFQINLVWKENRATYQNLKANNSLNALTQKDIKELWLPEVIYENTDQKETTRLGSNWEWKTEVVVKREGNSTISRLETVDETYIFRGELPSVSNHSFIL